LTRFNQAPIVALKGEYSSRGLYKDPVRFIFDEKKILIKGGCNVQTAYYQIYNNEIIKFNNF
jgi:hypothetical protein